MLSKCVTHDSKNQDLLINPSESSVTFLYRLKTSENLWFLSSLRTKTTLSKIPFHYWVIFCFNNLIVMTRWFLQYKMNEIIKICINRR